MSDTLLRVEDLKIYYPVAGSGFGKKEFVKAVDGVTFEVKKGEVFGIVGESGCGKSTLGRGVCKLENLTSGHVYLDGEDITEYNDLRMRSVRKKVQMVFQDPYASLNPRMSVFDIIAEPLLVHHLYQDKADLEKKVLDLLHRVGLDDYHANRYPHEFSGGQRQRIGIARALAVEPSLIIADEPVSALDVSVYAGTAFRSSGSGSDGKKRKNSAGGKHPVRPQAADRLQIPYQMSKMHGMLQNTGAGAV